MKYIDADRLRAEIKRRIDATINIHHIPCHRREELEGLLSFVDSLQQEQPEVDLEKAALNFAEEIGVPVSDTFLSIARHFNERGQRKAAEMYDEVEYNRQLAEEEMSDKTLDEAAEEECERCKDHDRCFWVDKGRIDACDYLKEFKAGAKWMAEQGVTCEGKVFTSAFTSYVKTPGIEELLKDVFPEDTEVIVQIRKKEESK